MIKANLTKEQEDIIKDICDLQIQSLLRVSMEDGVGHYFNNCGVIIPPGIINLNISNFIAEFDMLKITPSKVLMLHYGLLRLIKHHLFYYQDSEHKSNLYRKITIAEQFTYISQN